MSALAVLALVQAVTLSGRLQGGVTITPETVRIGDPFTVSVRVPRPGRRHDRIPDRARFQRHGGTARPGPDLDGRRQRRHRPDGDVPPGGLAYRAIPDRLSRRTRQAGHRKPASRGQRRGRDTSRQCFPRTAPDCEPKPQRSRLHVRLAVVGLGARSRSGRGGDPLAGRLALAPSPASGRRWRSTVCDRRARIRPGRGASGCWPRASAHGTSRSWSRCCGTISRRSCPARRRRRRRASSRPRCVVGASARTRARAALLSEVDLVKFARRPVTADRADALGREARAIATAVHAALTAAEKTAKAA